MPRTTSPPRDSYDPPVLAFMERAKLYARPCSTCAASTTRATWGPGAMERPFDYEPFMGQKSDAAFLVQPMLMRFYSTSTTMTYARKVYPFMRRVRQFWEDYLKFESGRYVIYDDCVGEVGPWHPVPVGQQPAPLSTLNPMNDLGFVRATSRALST